MNSSNSSNAPLAVIAAATFVVLAATSGVAWAADPGPTSITVGFADLKASSPSGAAALYERIRTAARSACAYYWFKTDADEARCVHDAIANAVAKVNQPALSAVYDSKNKVSAPSALVSQSR